MMEMTASVALDYVLPVLRSIANALGADRYSEHAKSLEHDPIMMILYVAGNLENFTAYITLGFVLLHKRAHIVHLTPDVFRMFGAFLLLGSLEYVAQTLTIFVAVYRLDVVVLALCGTVSCVVAWLTVMAVYGSD